MTIAEGIASIILWACSVGFVFALLGLRRKLRTDRIRHRLFVIRDELFDMTLNSSVGFDNEAYRLLRGEINNLLRYAHRLSSVNTIAAYLLGDHAEDDAGDEFFQALQEIPDEQVRKDFLFIKISVGVALSMSLPSATLSLLAIDAWRDRKKHADAENRQEYTVKTLRRPAVAAFWCAFVLSPGDSPQDEWRSMSSQGVLAHVSRQAREASYPA